MQPRRRAAPPAPRAGAGLRVHERAQGSLRKARSASNNHITTTATNRMSIQVIRRGRTLRPRELACESCLIVGTMALWRLLPELSPVAKAGLYLRASPRQIERSPGSSRGQGSRSAARSAAADRGRPITSILLRSPEHLRDEKRLVSRPS
jgi:hypothetical protein